MCATAVTSEDADERSQDERSLLGMRRVPQELLIELELETDVARSGEPPAEPGRRTVCRAAVRCVSSDSEAAFAQCFPQTLSERDFPRTGRVIKEPNIEVSHLSSQDGGEAVHCEVDGGAARLLHAPSEFVQVRRVQSAELLDSSLGQTPTPLREQRAMPW